MDDLELLNKHVKIYTNIDDKIFKYQGYILDETELFYKIHDTHDDKDILIAKKTITSIEVNDT
ncbi:hypothetical protein GOV10_02915 [Candidatus Woesearchaeota archaeon]|nr:hypothetical protein [Candidatus Woesearchaeota archaeon]